MSEILSILFHFAMKWGWGIASKDWLSQYPPFVYKNYILLSKDRFWMHINRRTQLPNEIQSGFGSFEPKSVNFIASCPIHNLKQIEDHFLKLKAHNVLQRDMETKKYMLQTDCCTHLEILIGSIASAATINNWRLILFDADSSFPQTGHAVRKAYAKPYVESPMTNFPWWLEAITYASVNWNAKLQKQSDEAIFSTRLQHVPMILQ